MARPFRGARAVTAACYLFLLLSYLASLLVDQRLRAAAVSGDVAHARFALRLRARLDTVRSRVCIAQWQVDS